jgi:DNA-binding HxlR family transcriptional regulator
MRTYGQYCPIARASELLAERWSIIILQAAQVGEQRVSQAGFLSGQLMPHNRPPRPLR